MKQGLNNLWPTPVLYDKIQDLDLMNRTVDYMFTNFDLEVPPSDFQKFDILRDGGPIMQEFRDNIVVPAFDKYLELINVPEYTSYFVNSWITSPYQGYRIPVHNHSGASLSAVFYLVCEEQNAGGEFTLIDPKANANRGYDKSFGSLFKEETFVPATGDVIIFPSYTYHYTDIFTGHMRLAIPVDFFPKFS